MPKKKNMVIVRRLPRTFKLREFKREKLTVVKVHIVSPTKPMLMDVCVTHEDMHLWRAEKVLERFQVSRRDEGGDRLQMRPCEEQAPATSCVVQLAVGFDSEAAVKVFGEIQSFQTIREIVGRFNRAVKQRGYNDWTLSPRGIAISSTPPAHLATILIEAPSLEVANAIANTTNPLFDSDPMDAFGTTLTLHTYQTSERKKHVYPTYKYRHEPYDKDYPYVVTYKVGSGATERTASRGSRKWLGTLEWHIFRQLLLFPLSALMAKTRYITWPP
eukprot:TRINITY_DN6094_c0_g1_i1.p1 TRINITY_DN6094_c0_g1~~TRINITY_DN6094_c0_g1_i1.p1  ORF type:complete len:273 (+),score=52.13 TRINITY_DN6094_c0_g1_i1:279-1097(+)